MEVLIEWFSHRRRGRGDDDDAETTSLHQLSPSAESVLQTPCCSSTPSRIGAEETCVGASGLQGLQCVYTRLVVQVCVGEYVMCSSGGGLVLRRWDEGGTLFILVSS